MDRTELDAATVFYEGQRFKQWWVWLILLAVNGFFLTAIFIQIVGGKQFGDKPMTNTEMLIVFGVTVLISFFFYLIKLNTRICRDGIYVRLFPIHLKYKFFPWDTLSRCYVREYSPIKEYGGWGLRYGGGGRGKAYNIAGKQGIQLEFTNGKKLLIGTQKAVEVTSALQSLKQWKE